MKIKENKNIGAWLWIAAGAIWIVASITNSTAQYAILGGLFIVLGLDKMRRSK